MNVPYVDKLISDFVGHDEMIFSDERFAEC